jgi:Domain of unknown function (DUF4432)
MSTMPLCTVRTAGRPVVGRVFSLLTLALGLSAHAHAQDEVFHKPLSSVDNNFHPHELLSPKQRRYQSRDIAPKCTTPWSVRLVTLHGGKQEGVELVVIDNGAMTINLVITRGMGILSVQCKDVRLGWDSPVHEVVHPSFINLASQGGLGWLEGFNEWLCRCGMTSNGAPGPDRIRNAAGEETTMDLTLHGRLANLPAQEVDLVAHREPPFTIKIRGRVDERMFHGPALELYTELWTEPGSQTFRIRDIVTNRGGQEQEFQMLYHINFGPPLLENGSVFLAPLAQVTASTEHAAKEITSFDHFTGPTPGFKEKVYFLRPRADSSGNTVALIRNKAGTRGASVRFSTAELPCLTLWNNTAATEDGYVIGIEPGTNFPNNRHVERKFGRVLKLAPGASHSMTLDFAIQLDPKDIAAITDQIAAIQGSQQPAVDDKPSRKD